MSALTVLLVSQPVGLVLAVIVALIVGGDSLSTRDTFIAAGAGATVVMALGAFYKAMALGSVTVVATIGALGVLVPVIGGLVQGDHRARSEPSARGRDRGRRPGLRARSSGARAPLIGLTALTALGFRTFFRLNLGPKPGLDDRSRAPGVVTPWSPPRSCGRRAHRASSCPPGGDRLFDVRRPLFRRTTPAAFCHWWLWPARCIPR
jgi:hypothetical protein